MARHDNFPEKQTWGTWEELLLACAVHRYGSDSWDSVAMELQKRTSTLQHLFVTPLACQQKFEDLKRRFSENDVGGCDAKTTNNNISTAAVPWLDQLRKLRVAELRREVQQYDLSIVSLQLKVQRLKEEREHSLRENGKVTEKLDLEREKESEKKDEEIEPVDQTRKPVHGGEESDRENRSVNESNSTDPKDESPETGPEEAKVEPEPVEPEVCEKAKVENDKPAGEDSCNGSCDSVAKQSAENSERVDPRGEPGDSPESVAESKGDEPIRESSDVQSSASLSGKEKKIAEPGEPDEPDNEELDQSPAIKEVSIESQPLVEFLEILRSHTLGSLFERRLESQETPDYLNLIRQHLDFESIRMRLEEGWYSGWKIKFFRDLLLLLNNAIVFFGKKSPQYMAAIEFRQLVSKEIAAQAPNSNVLPKEKSSTLPESQMPLNPEPEPSLPLSMKPKLSVPLIACRKRSSITAKASTSSSGQEKKRQPIASLMNEKPALDWKQQDKSSEKAEESPVTKKRTRERSAASGARKANKNVKTRNNTNTTKNSDTNSHAAISSKGGSSNENSESKGEMEKTNTNVSSKKRSAANFLNRMRSSSSNNGPLIETLKGVISSDNGKVDAGEQKKNSSSKADQRKDQISAPRTRSGGKKAKERGSPAKRSTGRPPKRAAAPSPATPSVTAKRGREVVENDSGTGQAKKRSRK
ncbi:pinin [Durio zibethinus]|uniref:Pinin n=1 Tax=Durio zibethinus TaxID=66656 RepID=A0A6P6APL5_DURZI|nr:pinin [Durio zibethinus]